MKNAPYLKNGGNYTNSVKLFNVIILPLFIRSLCPCYQDFYWHIKNNCHKKSGPGKADASRNVNYHNITLWQTTKSGKSFSPSFSIVNDSEVTVHRMEQENAIHKPRWLRYFKLSKKKTAVSSIVLKEIVLYDFELTKNGALKKKSWEYLQTVIVID